MSNTATPTAPESVSTAPATPVAPTAPATEPQGERLTITTSQLAERLKEHEERVLARERKAADERAAKAQQDAEQAKLKEDNEWKQLAAQHEDTVRTLQPELDATKAERDAAREWLDKHIKTQMRGWPDEAKALVPAADDAGVSFMARLGAFEKAQAVVSKLVTDGRQARPGNGAGQPRPHGGDPRAELEARMRNNPRYSI